MESLMMEAVHISETSISIYETRRYNTSQGVIHNIPSIERYINQTYKCVVK